MCPCYVAQESLNFQAHITLSYQTPLREQTVTELEEQDPEVLAKVSQGRATSVAKQGVILWHCSSRMPDEKNKPSNQDQGNNVFVGLIAVFTKRCLGFVWQSQSWLMILQSKLTSFRSKSGLSRFEFQIKRDGFSVADPVSVLHPSWHLSTMNWESQNISLKRYCQNLDMVACGRHSGNCRHRSTRSG